MRVIALLRGTRPISTSLFYVLLVVQRVFSLLVVLYDRTQIILCQFQG